MLATPGCPEGVTPNPLVPPVTVPEPQPESGISAPASMKAQMGAARKSRMMQSAPWQGISPIFQLRLISRCGQCPEGLKGTATSETGRSGQCDGCLTGNSFTFMSFTFIDLPVAAK
jgi:hypothetical protein